MSARPDHPTGSMLAQLAGCPGSWRAQQGLPDEDSEYSASGDRVHAALAKRYYAVIESRVVAGPPDEDSPEWRACSEQERETVEILAAREAAVIAPFVEQHGPPSEIKREWRCYMVDAAGVPFFSSQLDVVYLWLSLAVIFDYKSLWGDVPESSENYQLLAQVACLRDELASPYDTIFAAILQPSAKPILCEYTPEMQVQAQGKVVSLLNAANKADAPLVPGESQCRYCRAKLTCPALAVQTEALARMPEKAILEKGNLGNILDACVTVEHFIEAARKEARRRLKAGEVVDGWQLKAGAEVRTITDPQKALDAMTPFGVSVESVLACCKVGIGDLEEAHKKASGLKGRAAKDAFNDALTAAGCLELKEKAASLCRANAAA